MPRPTSQAKKIKAVQDLLKAELAEKPELPCSTRHVMMALAGDFEAPEVWRAMGTEEETVRKTVNAVRNALDNALQEIERPIEKIEQADVQRVIKLAKELRRAIVQSPLPADTTYDNQLTLNTEGLPDVEVSLGWHTIAHEPFGFAYPLAVVDVLDRAIDLATAHLDRRPARAVARRKDQPLVTAFVRNLAWLFGRHFGEEKRTAIAHITNAVVGQMKIADAPALPNPLDRSSVDGILKDRPRKFSPPT